MENSFLKKEIQREKLSDYLPYVCFDEETGFYYNWDNTAGFLLEIAPVPFSSGPTLTGLRNIFDLQYPKGTSIQIMLFADPHMENIFDSYMERRKPLLLSGKESDKFLYNWADNHCRYLAKHRFTGISNDVPVPFRNFRVFFSIKIKTEIESFKDRFRKKENTDAYLEDPEVKRVVNDSLVGVLDSITGALSTGYMPNKIVKPDELINMLHRVYNPNHEPMKGLFYDNTQEIRKQVIEADTVLKKFDDHLEIDGKYIKVKTPRIYSSTPNSFSSNLLIGDIFSSNFMQIPCPFILTLNVNMDDMKSYLTSKANLVLNQRNQSVVFSERLRVKQDEFRRTVSEMVDNKFVGAYLSLVLMENDKKAMQKAESVVEGIWGQHGYRIQNENYLQLPLFLGSLPFGLHADIPKQLSRHKPVNTATLANIAPIQADWRGTPTPTMLFLSRRGQVVTLDLHDSPTNKNCVIAATSGAGKSFLTNYMISNYLSIGGKVVVIDIGRSYKLNTERYDGQYIEFERGANFCLNVFGELTAESLTADKDDSDGLINMYVKLLAQMANPREIVSDFEYKMLMNVVVEAHNRLTKDQILVPQNYIDILLEYDEEAKLRGDNRYKDMAEKLKPYGKGGMFEKWFNGRLDVNFNKNLCVLELEELSQMGEFREVVLLLIISIIDRNLYMLDDRKTPKLVILDEAWDLLGGANTGPFIETGYRRARKYNGSFITITQGLMDFYKDGNEAIGQAIIANSAYKILLQQESEIIQQAVKKGVLVMSEFEQNLLTSVKTLEGRYSELFIKTNRFFCVARLFVDKFTSYLYSTSAEVVAYLNNKMLYEHKTIEEAIRDAIEDNI